MEDIYSKDSFMERLKIIYQDESLSDVTFNVDFQGIQKSFKAHKFVLAISSRIFRSMFYDLLVETDEVTITDVHPDAFEALLRYIYTDEVVIKDFVTAISLNNASKKYSIPHLQQKTNDYFFDNDVNPDEACALFQWALTMQEHLAVFKCLQTFENETVKVLGGRAFLNARPSTVKIIAQRKRLKLRTEFQLFKAVSKWAEEECKRLNLKWTEKNFKVVAKDVIPHIRFLAMSGEQIVSVMETKLFTSEEMNPILCRILKSYTTIPLNDCFCPIRQPRIFGPDILFFSNFGKLKLPVLDNISKDRRDKANDGLPCRNMLSEEDKVISFELKMVKHSAFIYRIDVSLQKSVTLTNSKEFQCRYGNINREDWFLSTPKVFLKHSSELSFATQPVLLAQGDILYAFIYSTSSCSNTSEIPLFSSRDQKTVNIETEVFSFTPKQGSYNFPVRSVTLYYSPYVETEEHNKRNYICTPEDFFS